jgi:hypothetical protein
MLESNNLSQTAEQNDWKQLDEWVADHKKKLAALAWIFAQEKADSEEFLGIDLQPQPHFVSCSKAAIETLNQNTDNRLREVLGILDGYQPQEEVLIIGMSCDRVKLLFFTPEPTPPECYEQVGKDFNTLLDELEPQMAENVRIKSDT